MSSINVDLNSYELSRSFTDWSFENPDKIKPINYAIYFFAIENCKSTQEVFIIASR